MLLDCVNRSTNNFNHLNSRPSQLKSTSKYVHRSSYDYGFKMCIFSDLYPCSFKPYSDQISNPLMYQLL